MAKLKKPPILMRKERGHLVPIDAWAMEQLDAIPEYKEVAVTVSEERSRGSLNLWWAGLGLLVSNLNDEDDHRFPTSRRLHEAFLEDLGYVEKVYRVDGSFTLRAMSVALDNMEEADFKILMERAAKIAIEYFGYDPWQTWKDARPKGNWR